MTPTREKVFGVAAYFFCSSTMLVINKFIFASFALVAARQLGLVEFDGYEWSKVQPYMIYVLAFVLAIYCNMRALAASNVETVIVFRTCTPLCVAILEWMFLGRRLPSLRSTGSLCMVLVGTIGYVLSDKQFSLYGWVSYTWVGIYFVLICFEMTYGKHIISGTKMSNPVLGSVFYTNTLSILPMFLLGFGIFDELDRIPEVQWNLPASAILLLSCVVGLSISWAGFNCRNLLSATSFTMLGVMCKMGTEAINVVIWDHHATMTGIMWLMLCIVGGTLYKQAPMRDASEQQYELVTTEPESLQEEPESEAGVPEQAAGVPLEPEQQLESEAV